MLIISILHDLMTPFVWCTVLFVAKCIDCMSVSQDNKQYMFPEGVVGDVFEQQLFGEGKCPLIYYVLFT